MRTASFLAFALASALLLAGPGRTTAQPKAPDKPLDVYAKFRSTHERGEVRHRRHLPRPVPQEHPGRGRAEEARREGGHRHLPRTREEVRHHRVRGAPRRAPVLRRPGHREEDPRQHRGAEPARPDRRDEGAVQQGAGREVHPQPGRDLRGEGVRAAGAEADRRVRDPVHDRRAPHRGQGRPGLHRHHRDDPGAGRADDGRVGRRPRRAGGGPPVRHHHRPLGAARRAEPAVRRADRLHPVPVAHPRAGPEGHRPDPPRPGARTAHQPVPRQ